MKKIPALILSFILLLVIIPMLSQIIYRSTQTVVEKVMHLPTQNVDSSQETEASKENVVTVFREESNSYEELLLEEYIVGVVAGEMPAAYELEALKAQAVAARTYTLNQLQSEDYMHDTVKHQVYFDESQMRERWGDEFDKYYSKVKQAVLETEGEIIEYNGEMITPFYFSISNGYTENAEDYWSVEYPYLKSVSSQWDLTAPTYEQVTEFSLTALRSTFNDSSLTKNDFKILSYTDGGNVEEISVGDTVYSGREFREKLGLRSSDFSLEFKDNKVFITTYGYGHGVGMSQYGANQLAKQGKNYQEILQYYYQNVNIIEKNS